MVSLGEDVDSKALRLWGKLNSHTSNRVKTGVELSKEGEAGEVKGQGSSEGAIVSARYLDVVVHDSFYDSQHVDMYWAARLQPLIFLDDLFRSTHRHLGTHVR